MKELPDSKNSGDSTMSKSDEALDLAKRIGSFQVARTKTGR